MIKTKSIYDKKEKSDGTRILVTRYYPRGIRKEKFDRWYRELSPSAKLLKSFKDGSINQSIFFQFFCKELLGDTKKMELCKDLAIASLRKNITILCYEKEEIFCHRFYIKKICEHQLTKLNKVENSNNKNNRTGYL